MLYIYFRMLLILPILSHLDIFEKTSNNKKRKKRDLITILQEK